MGASLHLIPSEASRLRGEHRAHQHEIRSRLQDFRAVPRERYFYELCYCLLTPQSSAVQCDAVTRELEHRHFLSTPFDAAPLLRSHNGGYVRFHHVKARRLTEARVHAVAIAERVESLDDDRSVRDWFARSISGLGMKEASHFVRNVGRLGVAIIDRHILRNLHRLGAIEDPGPPASAKRYRELEERFFDVAEALGIPAPELDLALWRRETGYILK